MEDKIIFKKESSTTTRKLGTLVSGLRTGVEDPRRLTTLRPGPDLTLGGVPKREFVPKIPSPSNSKSKKETKEEEFDKLLPGVIPELLKTSTETLEQAKVKQFQQQRLQKQREQRKKVSFGSSTSNSLSPFAAGPPQQDKHKKSSLGSVVEDNDFKNDFQSSNQTQLKKNMEIDVMNPQHPILLPFPQKENIIPIKLEGTSDNFSRLSLDKHFLKENEICFIQLPSSLPVTPSILKPDLNKEQKPESQKESLLGSTTQDFENNLTNIPEGYLGKIQIYKSGKIKLKIGDYLYDLQPGSESSFLQQVMILPQEFKQIYQLGNLSKRYITVPDLSSLL